MLGVAGEGLTPDDIAQGPGLLTRLGVLGADIRSPGADTRLASERVCRPRARLAAVAVALSISTVALAFGGCAVGERGPSDPSASLIVTRDFGAERLEETEVPRAVAHRDALALLASTRRVERRGSRVLAVDGVRAAPGQEWEPLVNGLDPALGPPFAPGREPKVLGTLAPGDVVQWDLRSAGVRAPATVGAFPEPLLSGFAGRRFPVRLECEDTASRACSIAREQLEAHGVPVSIGILGTQGGPTLTRVVVARWATARQIDALLPLEGDPRRSGAYARFVGGGRGLELLDAEGRARLAPPGTGLVAALRTGTDAPTWAVTGVDSAAAAAAARALTERALRDRYAVAVTQAGAEALPLGRSDEARRLERSADVPVR